MSKQVKIKTLLTFSVIMGSAVNAQSRQFPGVSVSGENERQADFIFRKQAKGSRKLMRSRRSFGRQGNYRV